MAKQSQLSESDILEFLDAGVNESVDTHPSDPLSKARVRVTLDQLRPYHNNPRQSRNPKFDSIMASIEARGLDHAPNISRCKPTDDFYTIVDGGNTRLEILQILHAKYQDLAQQAKDEDERLLYLEKAERFYRIECTFRPWVSESDTLAAHMCENEERGDTLFIEKAIAVKRFREVYHEEDKASANANGESFVDRPLTLRALADRITSQGWTISASHISRFEYATNSLLDVIPKTLWAGAGQPMVVTIRQLEKAYNDFWSATELGREQPEQMLNLFYETLAQHDDETLDIKGFCEALNAQLSDTLSLPFLTVCAEINALRNGGPVPDQITAPAPITAHSSDIINSSQNVTSESANSVRATPVSPPRNDNNNKTSYASSASAALTSPSPASAALPESPEPVSKFEREQLINGLAQQLAKPYSFELRRSDARNTGVFVVLPNTVFDPDTEHQKASIWWGLFRISRSYHAANSDQHLEEVLQKQYARYLERQSLLQMILSLEAALDELPETEFTLFQEIQRRLREFQHLL